MSAESELNQSAEIETKAPVGEWTVMGDAYNPEPEKREKDYGPDHEGLTKAADDLQKKRQQEDQEPIKREYKFIGCEHDGEPVPLN